MNTSEQIVAKYDRFRGYFGFEPEPEFGSIGVTQRLDQMWNEWQEEARKLKAEVNKFVAEVGKNVNVHQNVDLANRKALDLMPLASSERNKFETLLNACRSAVECGYEVPEWAKELAA